MQPNRNAGYWGKKWNNEIVILAQGVCPVMDNVVMSKGFVKGLRNAGNSLQVAENARSFRGFEKDTEESGVQKHEA
jgi:hypothetical protein